jgi:hypothetical protein
MDFQNSTASSFFESAKKNESRHSREAPVAGSMTALVL